MRLRSWHVWGYGALSGERADDLPDGLVLIYGRNEAGKSTLLSFLRDALFGFPPPKSASHRPPLSGGRHGGTIRLAFQDDEVTIEREVGRKRSQQIRRADGAELSEPELQRMLGGADRKLFEEVFTFDLEDLRDLRQLSADAARDALSSAGVAGAGRSARKASAELHEQADSLVRTRGACRAAELTERLRKLEEEREAALSTAQSYPELQAAEAESRERVDRIRLEIQQISSRSQRCATLQRLWKRVIERREIELKLMGFRSPQLTDAATMAQLTSLEEDRRTQSARLRDLPSLKKNYERARAAAAQAISELGPGWSEDRVAQFDRSLPVREHVRQREQSGEQARVSATEAERKIQQIENQDRATEAEIESHIQAAASLASAHAIDSQSLERLLAAASTLGERVGAAPPAGLRTKQSAWSGALEMQAVERRTLERLQINLSQIQIDEPLAALAAPLAPLAQSVALQRDRLTRLPGLEAELAAAVQACEEVRATLGTTETLADLVESKGTLKILESIQQSSQEIESARAALSERERDHENVRQQRAGLEKDLDRLRREIPGEVHESLETLERRRRDLAALRVLLTDDREARSRSEAAEMSRLELEELLAATGAAHRWAVPAWTAWLLGLIAAVFCGIALTQNATNAPAAAALLVAAVAFVFAAVFAETARRQHARSNDDLTRRRERLASVEEAARAARAHAEALAGEVAHRAKALGLSVPVSAIDLEDRIAQNESDRARRERANSLDREIRSLQEQIESWSDSERRRLEKVDASKNELLSSEAEWARRRQEFGLPDGVAPDLARDLVVKATEGRRREVDRADREAALEQLRSEILDWERRAKAALGNATHLPDAMGHGLCEAVLERYRTAAAEQQRLQQKSQAEEAVHQARERSVRADEAATRAHAELAKALRDYAAAIRDRWSSDAESRSRALQPFRAQIERAKDLEREFAAWKRSVGVSDQLSPQGVLDFLDDVKKTQALLADRRAAEDALRETENSCNEWDSSARAALQALGHSADGSAEEVTQRVAQAAEAQREAAALLESLQRVRREIDAGLGLGPEADAMRTELENGNVDSWNSQLSELERTREELETQRDQAIGALKEAELRRRQIEEGSDVARIETLRAQIESELAQCAGRALRLRLAAELILETLREFERERTPAVMTHASDLFRKVTRDRYTRLAQRWNENEIEVIAIERTGMEKTTDQLSRGTRELLYLCLRWSLAHDLAKRGIDLPLIMDDVLVNLDEARAEEAARALVSLAEHHQIFLFTCHEATRILLQRVAPEIRVVELAPRGPGLQATKPLES
ncbi:MAG: AAA family ATPase [Planctomycetes bacterium]|nr:AAA family ATPase [Planctomycetota bacterium]